VIDYVKRKEAHAQVFLVCHFRETPLLSETLQGIKRTPLSDPDVPGILTIALRFFSKHSSAQPHYGYDIHIGAQS
jgi:hypothetical protein